jgi:hypothetical protein
MNGGVGELIHSGPAATLSFTIWRETRSYTIHSYIESIPVFGARGESIPKGNLLSASNNDVNSNRRTSAPSAEANQK